MNLPLADILGALAQFAGGGAAALMVTHSTEVAHRAHRTIRLEAGPILSGNNSAV